MLLKNKNIVIIGGTTGLGLSAAKAFIKEGAKVLVIGRKEESCKESLKVLGENSKSYSGDATEENTATAAIENCVREFGSFQGLYHVAGGSGRRFGDGPLHEISLEGWRKTIDLNLTSVMLSNRAAIKYFLENKEGGTILNMGSVLGFSPSPEYFSTHTYAACKAAIIGFSRSVASYYAKNNIRINVVAPALVETPMAQRAANDEKIIRFIKSKQPLDGGRIGKPGDLDGAACYFMSDQSAFVTGQVLSIDGGWDLSEGQYQEMGDG